MSAKARCLFRLFVLLDDLFLCLLLLSYGATQLPKVELRLHHRALEKTWEDGVCATLPELPLARQ